MNYLAKRYGIKTYSPKEIYGKYEKYVCIDYNCYIKYEDYDMFIEIMEKEYFINSSK